jgi:chromodomain-helicase-DNA-binding protein 7
VSPEYKFGFKLRPWQLEGVNWLLFNWHQRRGCILADEMVRLPAVYLLSIFFAMLSINLPFFFSYILFSQGLGKTAQSVALVKSIRDSYSNGPFLVVAPLSTIGHWKREFEGWTDMNVVVLQGSRQDRDLTRTYEWCYWDLKGNEVPKHYKFNVHIYKARTHTHTHKTNTTQCISMFFELR